MSLFLSMLRLSDNQAREKSKKWKSKAEMQKKLLALKVKRHSSPLKSAFFKQDVLGVIALLETPRRRSIQNKRDRISAQEVRMFNPDDLEVASIPK